MSQEITVAEMQEAESCRRDHANFGRVLVISFLVHVACSVLVLSHQRGNNSMAPVPSFDLTMTEPQTAPVQPAQPAVQEEPVSLPEPPPQPPALSEYEKLRQDSRKAVETAATPEAIRQVSLGLGITNGYFSSFANGQSLNDDIRDYYFTILQTINEKWWVGRGSHSGARNKVMINVVIARDGNVVQTEIVRGSGSFSYDRSLLKALEAASPFPPLPERFRQAYFSAPLLFNPPLNLLDGGNNS